ncbi:MAG: TIGR04283 family arsenosugar biosynthesis glycosyltransferase [Burkholderiales bacterium]|nr:TIGR04283 family arsenosugar biosynthesis glycosyltransferase [Burkholderiales bacterium]
MRLSIIVPVLNEATQLPHLLESLIPLVRNQHEVIIVDGGSKDGTPQLATCLGFTVIHAERGRARQMNAGAQQAHGDVLLFLHADTILPASAEFDITQALCRTGATGNTNSKAPCWGRFDVHIAASAWMFRVIEKMINLRSRLSGIATGDQALFVRRDSFQPVGGFPEVALMEDIALSKKLKQLSRSANIRACVSTSGRRWESKGIWRTIFLMWRLRWLYWRGVSPQDLWRHYQ